MFTAVILHVLCIAVLIWNEMYIVFSFLYRFMTLLKQVTLKTLDTIGNCQRPVLSQHMHKITPVKV